MISVPRVLVTDCGRGSAISVIRSLGRHGFEVVAADAEPRSPGFYSRYARGRLRYPDPRSAPQAAVEALLGAARERQIDLIVPVTDDVLLPLSRERDRFRGVCALAIPDPEALAATLDKLSTLELARALGVPTPRTEVVATRAEARERAPALGWPVVLKPKASRVYRDGAVESYRVAYAESPAEVEAEMARLEGGCSVLLQEYVRGEAHGVELLLDRGAPLAAFQHRRLREVPLSGGPSSLRESVPLDPTLYDQSVRMLRELEWTGLAMVEFKVAADGPRLMEINGRIWGSLPLAIKSGVDFPAGLAELYLGGRSSSDGLPGPNAPYALGVRSRNLELELSWIASTLWGRKRYAFLDMPPRREALAAALRLFSAADGFDILCREDPRPGIAEIRKIAGKVLRKLVGRD